MGMPRWEPGNGPKARVRETIASCAERVVAATRAARVVLAAAAYEAVAADARVVAAALAAPVDDVPIFSGISEHADGEGRGRVPDVEGTLKTRLAETFPIAALGSARALGVRRRHASKKGR